jgi:AraC-like DNA-binding protein
VPLFNHASDEEYEKRGYLFEEFRLFHLTDPVASSISYHYHDFHKILFFLNGEAGYSIEGASYDLAPGDIVLIPRYSIHRPEIRPGCSYERIILYLSPEFLTGRLCCHENLDGLFQGASDSRSYVLHLPRRQQTELLDALSRLEAACRETGFADGLLRRLVLLELIILLNRSCTLPESRRLPASSRNAAVLSMMQFIHDNADSELTIDGLASRFYMSRSHMMRLFKRETGYTIGAYINEKRLLMARQLLDQGLSVTECCYRCGFKNYDAFLRAYKKSFHETPKRRK